MSLFREYVERFAPQNQGESCPARWLATPEEQAKRERELRQAAARVAERRAAFDAAWDAQAEERQRLYDAGDIPGLTALDERLRAEVDAANAALDAKFAAEDAAGKGKAHEHA